MNIFRKIIVEAINQMIPVDLMIYKVTAAFLIIFVFWRLQLRLNPYKVMQYNVLEQREMICSIFCLFITYVFVNNEVSLAVNYTLLFLLFLTVYWFFSCWLFLVYSKSFPRRF